MNKEYYCRKIEVSIDTSLLEPYLKLKLESDIGDSDITEVARKTLDLALPAFSRLLSEISIPADSLAGDEPMILLQIEYSDVEDDNCDALSFSVIETEAIESGKWAEALSLAATMAISRFTEKVKAATTEGSES